LRWTPSLHAVLRAGVAGDDLGRFAVLDGQWIDALKALCAGVDLDALRALAAAAVAGGRRS
jgi:DNA-binding transcriptional regulator LsrR (DeoR family)